MPEAITRTSGRQSPSLAQSNRSLVLLSLVLAALALPLLGCNRGAETDDGTVASSDGRATVLLPAGTLPDGVNASDVQIQERSPGDVFDFSAQPDAEGRQPLRADHVIKVYELGPDGTQLAQPARVRLAFERDAILDAGGLAVAHLAGEGLEWLEPRLLEDESDETTFVYEVEVQHFSVLAAVRPFFSGSIAPERSRHAVGTSFTLTVTVRRNLPFQLLEHGGRRHAVSTKDDRWGPPSLNFFAFFFGETVSPSSSPSSPFAGGAVTGPGPATRTLDFTCEQVGNTVLTFNINIPFVAEILSQRGDGLISTEQATSHHFTLSAQIECVASPPATATATPTATSTSAAGSGDRRVSIGNARTGVDHPPFDHNYGVSGASVALACGQVTGAPQGSTIFIDFSGAGTPGGTVDGPVTAGGTFVVPVGIFEFGPFSWEVQSVRLPDGTTVTDIQGAGGNEVSVGPAEPKC